MSGMDVKSRRAGSSIGETAEFWDFHTLGISRVYTEPCVKRSVHSSSVGRNALWMRERSEEKGRRERQEEYS